MNSNLPQSSGLLLTFFFSYIVPFSALPFDDHEGRLSHDGHTSPKGISFMEMCKEIPQLLFCIKYRFL